MSFFQRNKKICIDIYDGRASFLVRQLYILDWLAVELRDRAAFGPEDPQTNGQFFSAA